MRPRRCRLIPFSAPFLAALCAVLSISSSTLHGGRGGGGAGRRGLLVDAPRRSWTDLVPLSSRGIATSVTKKADGVYSYGWQVNPNRRPGSHIIIEQNPFLKYAEPTEAPTANRTASPTGVPTLRPTHNKTDVPSTLRPTAVESVEPSAGPTTSKPTAFPTDEPTSNPTDEPTLDPTDEPTLEPSPSIWGILDDSLDCSEKDPCGPCEGRCSKPEECLDGLVCHERAEDDDPVPGCEGEAGNRRRNYCIVPEGAWAGGWRRPTSNPTLNPTTLSPTDEPTSSPTQSPTDEPTMNPTTATPTHSPLDAAQYMIGNDYGRDCDSDHHERCNRCQGGCRRDRDCHPGLKCMERGNKNRRDDPVPGCVGTPERGTNYCYLDPEDAADTGGWAAPTPTFSPTASPTHKPTISFEPTVSQHPSAHPTASPTRQPAKVTDSFKLRMWWQRGYNWQGSSRPSDWCVKKSGRTLELDDCSSKKSDQKFVEYAGTIRPKGSQDKCFTKDGNDVVLEDCNGEVGGNNQQWVFDAGLTKKKYGGDTERDDLDDVATDDSEKGGKEYRRPYDVLMTEEKFEIHPKNDLGKCVTNHHQPRNGEAIMIQDCIFPRRSDTSFWKLD